MSSDITRMKTLHKIAVECIYRSPGQDINKLNSEFDLLIQNISLEKAVFVGR